MTIQAATSWRKIASANSQTLIIAQIETATGLRNVDEIAAVAGVDVLWIGHFDLTNSLGICGQFDHPKFKEGVAQVLAACKRHGKAAGFPNLSRPVGDGVPLRPERKGRGARRALRQARRRRLRRARRHDLPPAAEQGRRSFRDGAGAITPRAASCEEITGRDDLLPARPDRRLPRRRIGNSTSCNSAARSQTCPRTRPPIRARRAAFYWIAKPVWDDARDDERCMAWGRIAGRRLAAMSLAGNYVNEQGDAGREVALCVPMVRPNTNGWRG